MELPWVTKIQVNEKTMMIKNHNIIHGISFFLTI